MKENSEREIRRGPDLSDGSAGSGEARAPASVFTNPASASSEQAAAYVRAVLGLLGDREPLEVLEETPGALHEAIAGMPEAELSAPEAEGKWSIRQVLRHLADSEIVWGYRLRMVLAHERAELTGYDQDAWAERLRYEDTDPTESLQEFRILRRGHVRLLRGASPGDLERVGIHAERGEESVRHMMRLYAGHDLLHLRQVKRIREAVGVAAILFGLAACEAPAPAAEVVVRDSAGVRVVETTAAARLGAPIAVDSTPTVTIGTVAGEGPGDLLNRVVGAMQLPTGEILVGNGGSNELRFYGPDGDLLRTEGREGQGPGEYEYMRGLGHCREDGFVAFDLNWQMNAYDGEGDFVEKTVFRAPDGISPYKLACDPHGHVLLLGWGRAGTGGPRIGFHEARDRLVLVDREGAIVTDFGERLVSERIGTTGGSRPHPAGRATLFALHEDVVYVGSGEAFELELRDLDGELISLLRGPRIPLETTDSLRAAHLDRAVSRAPAEQRPAVRRQVGEWEWPPGIPAYTELLVDPEGTAWLRAFRIDPDEPEVWSLLDPGRGYLGDVTLRPGQTLLEVGRDYLLLLQRDAFDVESVVRVEMERHLGVGPAPLTRQSISFPPPAPGPIFQGPCRISRLASSAPSPTATESSVSSAGAEPASSFSRRT